MPLKRSSEQPNKTLIEFYNELTSLDHTNVESFIGRSMLSFIEMVNQTFKETELFGLTSHYRLILKAKDLPGGDWLVTISCYGTKEFEINYLMPDDISPWKFARVHGLASNLEIAKKYLIIAMTNSRGWGDSEELKRLYNSN